MTIVEYYVPNGTPENDATWNSKLGLALIGSFGGMAKVPGAIAVINFAVGAIVSAGAVATAEEVAIELEYISETQVKIDGITYQVDALTDSVLTSAITLGIVSAVSVLSPFVITSAAVVTMTIVTGTVVGVFYNEFVDPITDTFWDSFAGTINASLELKSLANEVVIRAVYQDGLSPLPQNEAVKDIIEVSFSNSVTPRPIEGETVDLTIGAKTEVYTIYSRFIDGVVEGLYGGNLTNFLEDPKFGGGINRDLYAESAGVFFARDGLDLITVPTPSSSGFSRSIYHVSDIVDGSGNVVGDNKDNLIIGSNGVDTFTGGGGADYIVGQGGNDIFMGRGTASGLDGDTFIGGSVIYSPGVIAQATRGNVDGTDTVDYSGVNFALKLSWAGQDGIVAQLDSAGGKTDTLISIENYILTGEADTVVITDADLLNNYFIDGNGGNDTLDLSGVSIAVDADFGEAGNITFTGFTDIIGGDGDDNISGDETDNLLFGGAGDDTINGGAGNDRLIGGLGSDILNGGAGDDIYYYSANGINPLWQQSGSDFISDSSGINDTVFLLGGYKFNPVSFAELGGALLISSVATIDVADSIENITYSDSASFNVARLILDEGLASVVAANDNTQQLWSIAA